MRYEFASPAWCAALHGLIAERVVWEVKEKPNLSMSICEVFTDAPAHLADANGRAAWSCIVTCHTIDFRRTERDDVRFKVIGDYATILPLGRYDTRGEPTREAELARMAIGAVESGRMKLIGELTSNDQAITSIHDAIARLTL